VDDDRETDGFVEHGRRVRVSRVEFQSMPNNNLPARRDPDELQLREFEARLLAFIDQHGLPTASILVGVPQRAVVFQNVEAVLMQIPEDQLGRSAYTPSSWLQQQPEGWRCGSIEHAKSSCRTVQTYESSRSTLFEPTGLNSRGSPARRLM
jgi:hypothetical protein